MKAFVVLDHKILSLFRWLARTRPRFSVQEMGGAGADVPLAVAGH